MANGTEIAVPTVENEVSGMKLTATQRARVVAAAVSDAAKRAAERTAELRRKALARTRAVRERYRKPVPMSIGAILGGAVSEPIRRDLIGRFTDNIYGQAIGMAALGALAQAAEEGLGVPGLGSVGVGMMGVGGWMGTVKIGYDSKDKRDPVAVALEGTTRKAKKDREKKNGEQKKEEKAE